jgi:hypothetical protein
MMAIEHTLTVDQVKARCDRDMAAFDQLPKVLRDFIDAGPLPVECDVMLAFWRKWGTTEAMRALQEAWDDHAARNPQFVGGAMKVAH